MESVSTPTLPVDIIDFYLTKSPHAHSDKGCSAQSVDLSTYGWEKNHLDTLMKWIVVKHANARQTESAIMFTIAKEIPDTQDAMLQAELDNSDSSWLGGAFCIQQRLSADTSNTITCKLTETYATCFFRHIRNSIAHGNYRLNKTGKRVLFRDQAAKIGTPNASATATLLTSVSLLQELIKTIEKGPDGINENLPANAPAYRVSRKVEALVEPIHE